MKSWLRSFGAGVIHYSIAFVIALVVSLVVVIIHDLYSRHAAEVAHKEIHKRLYIQRT